MQIDTNTQRHIWRFDGAFDLPEGQPQHGDISLTKQDTPSGWKRLNILAVYYGPHLVRLPQRRQYLLCDDDVVVADGIDRRDFCPFHYVDRTWQLRVLAGHDRHDFTLAECLEMPPLLDSLDIFRLEILEVSDA